MKRHETSLTVQARRLALAFEDCTLPRSQWTHAIRMRIALYYLLEFGFPRALRRLRKATLRYNARTGATERERNSYHESILVFSLWMLQMWRVRNARTGSTCERHVLLRRLDTADIMDPERIMRHYSMPQLFGGMAALEFRLPDRSRLPARVADYLVGVSRRAASSARPSPSSSRAPRSASKSTAPRRSRPMTVRQTA